MARRSNKDYDIYEEYIKFELLMIDDLYRYLYEKLQDDEFVSADDLIELAEDKLTELFYEGALHASDSIGEDFIDIDYEDVIDTVYRRQEKDGKNFADRISKYDGERPQDCSSELERIFVTDGHRCFTDGQQIEAEKHPNVWKIWDATMDDVTRDTHAELNGQQIPINEFFYTKNGKALAPSQFGIPEEDVNCRCILQFKNRGAE